LLVLLSRLFQLPSIPTSVIPNIPVIPNIHRSQLSSKPTPSF